MQPSNPPSQSSASHAAQAKAAANYLDVRYTPARRPITPYPLQLCTYLTKTYLQGRGYQTLLDLGCGRGDFLNAFAKNGFKAQGVDHSVMTERVFPEPVLVADFEGKTIPIADKTFDVVFQKSVIEHIVDTKALLHETYRLLKPGGTAIIMTPDWRANVKNFYDDYTHVRPFTLMGLEDAVLDQGFKIRDAKLFRQLPSVWRFPLLHLYFDLLSLLPDRLKRYKYVKWSKEWMLLVVAERPLE
jgi:SAM-dependent methyltransferase